MRTKTPVPADLHWKASGRLLAYEYGLNERGRSWRGWGACGPLLDLEPPHPTMAEEETSILQARALKTVPLLILVWRGLLPRGRKANGVGLCRSVVCLRRKTRKPGLHIHGQSRIQSPVTWPMLHVSRHEKTARDKIEAVPASYPPSFVTGAR